MQFEASKNVSHCFYDILNAVMLDFLGYELGDSILFCFPWRKLLFGLNKTLMFPRKALIMFSVF